MRPLFLQPNRKVLCGGRLAAEFSGQHEVLAHAAGYDLTTADAYERTLAEFDQVVGLRHLVGAHLNDSKTELGSRVDRHESLGKGTMGWEPFRLLMNDPRFDDLPLITETVNRELWAEELTRLPALIGQTEPYAQPPRDSPV